MLEVGCPEPAPVLERMLSTRNCCASARHCSAPTVCWLICCVIPYLLDGTAVLSETDCILYYPASVIQKLRPTHSAERGDGPRGERDRQGGGRREDQDRPVDRQERKEERQQRREERQEHRQARQERR